VKVKVITANRTLSGATVYLTPAGQWSAALADAFWSTDAEAMDTRLTAARAQQRQVCDPYLLTVGHRDERLVPLTKREEIRANGPIPMLEALGYGQSFLEAAGRRQGDTHVSL
jgi:hypothetical protein